MTPEEQLAAVQQALADPRLALASRAVAAWLALHPHRHSVTFIQTEFALSRRTWEKVRNELQEAGYLTIDGPKRRGGKWVWEVTGAIPTPVDNSPSVDNSICTKRADEVICTDCTCTKRADIEVLTKPIEINKNCPGGQAPVDNSQEKPASKKNQIFIIQDQLKLSRGQLGHILNICKQNSCQLQVVYQNIGKYMRGIFGNQAVAYIKKCIMENPGRDWKWEARRDAEQRAEQAFQSNEHQAFERFMGKIQEGEEIHVQSPKNGEPLILRQRIEAPEFVCVLGADGQFKGSLPARMAFDQLISPPAE